MTDIFTHLPDNARVWIYQADRNFTPEELPTITAQLQQFVTEWASHSRKVIAGGELLYNRFIVLIADESEFQVSGCSIDSSVHFIRQLGADIGADMFDRLQVAWKDGDLIRSAGRGEFSQALAEGWVTEDTIVFNNMVQTKQALLTQWEIPLRDSWHARVFAG